MTAEGRSIEISRLEKQPSTTTMTQQAHQLRGYLQVKHNAQTRGKRLMRKVSSAREVFFRSHSS